MKIAVLIAAALMASSVRQTSAGPVYRIESVVPIPGAAPSWDYLTFDAGASRIFIGRRAAGVSVFDVGARKITARIEWSEGANAATLVPDFDRGFTTNGDGSMTIFRLSTLKTLDRIRIGKSADNAFYDPVTKQLMVTMGDDKLLTFVDPKTATVTGTLAMPAHELEGAVADGKGAFYVNERDLDKVAKIDATTRRVVAEWSATGCEQPTGMAIDVASGRLFLGCKGERPVLAVMDASNGAIVARLPIGRGNDGVVYDAETKQVFTTNGIDGNLVIYKQNSRDAYELVEALTTRPMARTLTIDPKTKTIYSASAEGMVDPTKPRNERAGPLYPNSFFDNTFDLLIISQH